MSTTRKLRKMHMVIIDCPLLFQKQEKKKIYNRQRMMKINNNYIEQRVLII